MKCKADNKIWPLQFHGTFAESHSGFDEPHFFFYKKTFLKTISPWVFRVHVGDTIKSCRRHFREDLSVLHIWIPSTPLSLVLEWAAGKKCCEQELKRQSHHQSFFRGPSLQLGVMGWQRIPTACGSTTYKTNLEHLFSQGGRRKHQEPVPSQHSLHSCNSSASQLRDPAASNRTMPMWASCITQKITSLVITMMGKSDVHSPR